MYGMVLLKQFYRKQQFLPSFLGIFINPFYFVRRELYQFIKKYGAKIIGKSLDVGCGNKPYKGLFSSEVYIGMDIENSGHDHRNENVDVFYDGKVFPFPNNEFDSIVCNQVFEHVFNPDQFICEINRVLKNQGYLLFSVPFIWDEHEQPYDFARYSSFGIKAILEKNGFVIIKFRKSCKGFISIIQILSLYVYKSLLTRSSFLNLIIGILIISPINFLGYIVSIFLPKNEDLYLDNIILAQKIQNA